MNDSLKNSRIPDFSNTLYWDAELQSMINDTLTFEFTLLMNRANTAF